MQQGIKRGIVLGGLFTSRQNRKEKKEKEATDKVAGEAKVVNGGVLQLSSTEGGWC